MLSGSSNMPTDVDDTCESSQQHVRGSFFDVSAATDMEDSDAFVEVREPRATVETFIETFEACEDGGFMPTDPTPEEPTLEATRACLRELEPSTVSCQVLTSVSAHLMFAISYR